MVMEEFLEEHVDGAYVGIFKKINMWSEIPDNTSQKIRQDRKRKKT